MDVYDILDFCNEPDIFYGYNCRYNEIWSMGIGEVEEQLTGLYNHDLDIDCMYTHLCEGLTDEEITQAENACEWCISGDFIYIDHSYDRVSIVLDVDKLLKAKRRVKLRLVI